MALAWVLKDGIVTSVLIGASRPAQILDNIKALENTHFTEEELRIIDHIYKKTNIPQSEKDGGVQVIKETTDKYDEAGTCFGSN